VERGINRKNRPQRGNTTDRTVGKRYRFWIGIDPRRMEVDSAGSNCSGVFHRPVEMIIWGGARGVPGYFLVSLYKRVPIRVTDGKSISHPYFKGPSVTSSLFQRITEPFHMLFFVRLLCLYNLIFLLSSEYGNASGRSASVSLAACFFKYNALGKRLKKPLL